MRIQSQAEQYPNRVADLAKAIPQECTDHWGVIPGLGGTPAAPESFRLGARSVSGLLGDEDFEE